MASKWCMFWLGDSEKRIELYYAAAHSEWPLTGRSVGDVCLTMLLDNCLM
jgi:hypothetical protein